VLAYAFIFRLRQWPGRRAGGFLHLHSMSIVNAAEAVLGK
jgi:hypothetical protein